MNWIRRGDVVPEDEQRILIYYPEREPEHRFQVIAGKFFRIATDATHWSPLVGPNDEEN